MWLVVSEIFGRTKENHRKYYRSGVYAHHIASINISIYTHAAALSLPFDNIFVFAQGAKGLVVVDKNAAGGEETVKLIKETGFQNVVFQQADVSKAEDCEKFVQVAEKQFGQLNVLFNNAGIMHMESDNKDIEERLSFVCYHKKGSHIIHDSY